VRFCPSLRVGFHNGTGRVRVPFLFNWCKISRYPGENNREQCSKVIMRSVQIKAKQLEDEPASSRSLPSENSIERATRATTFYHSRVAKDSGIAIRYTYSESPFRVPFWLLEGPPSFVVSANAAIVTAAERAAARSMLRRPPRLLRRLQDSRPLRPRINQRLLRERTRCCRDFVLERVRVPSRQCAADTRVYYQIH
jgi:hypothetical protein